MTRFKLVAFDLDGTLVGPEGIVSSRVRAAIERLPALGIAGCIVTGRMFRAAVPFARDLGLLAPLVCYQGASIVDPRDEVILRDVPLDHAVVVEIIRIASDVGMHLQLYRNDEYYCERRNRFSDLYARLSGIDPVIVPSLAETFASGGATKAVFIADAADVELCAPRLRDELGGRAYVTRSYPEFVECMNPTVDKGDALRFVADRLGIALAGVAAIGDAWNDVPLLRSAGFGIAMGSAPPELRVVAAAIVADVRDDGVAEALEEYVLS
jgi:Cof subfamily protein (haloacid dehalogenase superfamily)